MGMGHRSASVEPSCRIFTEPLAPDPRSVAVVKFVPGIEVVVTTDIDGAGPYGAHSVTYHKPPSYTEEVDP